MNNNFINYYNNINLINNNTLIIDKNKLNKALIIYNKFLNKKCNKLYLDYIYTEEEYNKYNNISTFNTSHKKNILCLNYNNKCISNISIINNNNEIHIESMTIDNYRNKKYNKLLRIIIFNLIYYGCILNGSNNKFKKLVSLPVNIYSIYSLNSIFKLNKNNINISFMQNNNNNIDFKNLKNINNLMRINKNNLFKNINFNLKKFIDFFTNKYKNNVIFFININISKDNYKLSMNSLNNLFKNKNINKQIKCN